MVATIGTSGGANAGVAQALANHRLSMVGATGSKGLIKNARTFAIAVFASMGGLIYGYNQGMFGQILSMHSFSEASGVKGIDNPTLFGFLTAILELGAWVGVLMNGYVSDAVGRKKCVVFGVSWFILGVIIQACTRGGSYDYILAGRSITGVGIGSLSMIVPLYNAELAPPEIRGSLVALQQLAIVFGIMISYWLTYGTQYIGGTGAGQSRAAWLAPTTIQLAPAVILAVGIFWLPESPRWLINEGREQESLSVIAGLRRLPEDDLLVQLEFLEVKAQKLFEDRISAHDHPNLQDGSRSSNFKLGLAQYKSLVANPANLRRTLVAIITMTFQQWSGVNFILYYAPFIFQQIGLDGGSISLLASGVVGVVGVVMFLATIPAVHYIDTWGRKPILIAGTVVMGICHFVVAVIIATCRDNWPAHKAAGWVSLRQGHNRNAFDDTLNLLSRIGQSMPQLETAIDKNDVPNFSSAVLASTMRSYKHYLEYVTLREHLDTHSSRPEEEAFAAAKKRMDSAIKDGEKHALLHNPNIWVLYLHLFALSGHERINEETVAHTNVRAKEVGSLPFLRSINAASPQEEHDDEQVDEPPFFGAEQLAELRSAFSMEDCDAEDSIEEEQLRLNDDDVDEQLPLADDSGDNSFDRTPDEPLNESDLKIVEGLPPPPPDSRPLALGTIKSKFEDVLRQLKLFKIHIDKDVRETVLRIIKHLARQRSFYPTGRLRKEWVGDATVSKLLAAVWNVAGQENTPSVPTNPTAFSGGRWLRFGFWAIRTQTVAQTFI
ncbi:hypothetical protein NDA16_002967 [Ustilago loliicola]|nr:hypothetical protein NDA16_002967 [Ustilago loliicola]